MFEAIRGKLLRFRARLLMRSALTGGLRYRLMRSLVRQRFNDRSRWWDQMVGDHEHKWFQPLDAALERLPAGWYPSGIVDIGGGTGRAGYYIARRYPRTLVTVIDIAPNMLRTGVERQLNEQLPTISFVAGDSTALPLSEQSFDLAFALNSPVNVRELRRILRPGGVAILGFTWGRHTPMYLDESTARRALSREGFMEVSSGVGGEGNWTMGHLPGERPISD